MRHLRVTSVSFQTSRWYVSGLCVPVTEQVTFLFNWKHDSPLVTLLLC